MINQSNATYCAIGANVRLWHKADMSVAPARCPFLDA